MKLWRVTYENEIVVAADTLDDAWEVARECAQRDISLNDAGECMVHPDPIENQSELPREWDGECVPYYADDEAEEKRLKEFF